MVIVAIILLIISIQGFEKSELLDAEIDEVLQELNDKTLILLDLCYDTKSLEALQLCKTRDIPRIIESCKDKQQSGLPVCSDPRLKDFSLTIDSRIENVIDEPDIVPSIKNVFDLANQNMLDFMDRCTSYTSDSLLNGCARDAKQMVEICNTDSTVLACSDPRLRQIANNNVQSKTDIQSPIKSESSLEEIPYDADLQWILARTVRNCIENTTVFLNEATDVLDGKSSYDNYEESIQINAEKISICSAEIKEIEEDYCHWFGPSCTVTEGFESYWELIPKLELLSDDMCEKLGYMCMYNFNEN